MGCKRLVVAAVTVILLTTSIHARDWDSDVFNRREERRNRAPQNPTEQQWWDSLKYASQAYDLSTKFKRYPVVYKLFLRVLQQVARLNILLADIAFPQLPKRSTRRDGSLSRSNSVSKRTSRKPLK